MTKQELSKLLDEKLQGVATKEDMGRVEKGVAGLERKVSSVEEQMATKKDLAKLEVGTASKEDLAKLEARMATKKDLMKLESGIRQVLADGIIPQLDKLATRMEDLRDGIGRIERQLYAVVNRQDRQGEVVETHVKTLADHEQRLGILEPAAS